MKERELLVVTGATGGLGRCIARFFAEEALLSPSLHPVFCCRNAQKGEALCREVEALGLSSGQYTLLQADLSTKAGVDVLAKAIVDLDAPIHWLVNNAAGMFANYGTTADGVELHMGVNFLAPARLSERLVPLLSAGSSLVNILSCSRNFFPLKPGFLIGPEKGYFRLRSYSRSKLALSIFTADMAERYPHLHINGVDPGVMNTGMLKMDQWFDPLTDLFFRPFTRKPEQSLPAVIAACRNTAVVSGQIFTNRRYFPIERKIAQHPLKAEVRTAVMGTL